MPTQGVTASYPCDENEICVNLDGSYDCKCAEGFHDDYGACEDINECRKQE